MSDLQAIPTEPPPPPRKGRPVLAWLVILAVVAFLLWRYAGASPLEAQQQDLLNTRLTGRYVVGAAETEDRLLGAKQKGGREQLYAEAEKTLNRGTYPQRLRFVVLAGELKGAAEAREQLRRITQRYHECLGDPPAEEAETARLLDRLYAVRQKGPAATAALTADERDELRQRLGWFGDLALTPAGADDAAARAAVLAPAYRTVASLLGVGTLMLGAGGLGLVILVLLFVLYCLGRLGGGLAPGSPHAGVYAETFAVYMLLYFGLALAARYGLRWVQPRHGTIALSGVVALGSLAALFWPVLRGIPWRQVREDIGWGAGRRPWLEVLYGVGCYATALPMLFVGIGVFFLLAKLRDALGWGPEEFGPSKAPGHPISLWVASAPWWVWLEVIFVACVAAPLVEETMFRGVLYRHLRDSTRALRPWQSVLVSALVVSFLFAVIHPQGFLGVPPLMALALAFTLTREWRGTLLPPMIAHAVNNGVATLLLGLMLS